MNYTKPMILTTTDATSTIMGQKGIGAVDNANMSSPLNSVSAYEGDE